MSSRKATQEYRLAQWLPVVKECKNSGMSVKSWCQQNGINEKQFYYWQSKLRVLMRESDQAQGRFVSIPVQHSQNFYPTTFLPTLVIRVGDAAIEIASDVQPELLASVVKVLKDA